MPAEETKHDLWLKRTQIIIAILAGVATLVLGVYNVKKSVFSKTMPGSIVASIQSDRGQALSGALIELSNAQNALVSSTPSDQAGAYLKKELEPGTYIFKVSAYGFEPQLLNVQVASNNTSDLKIVLKSLPQQRNADGSPIKSALEEVGASWLKKLGSAKLENAESKPAQ